MRSSKKRLWRALAASTALAMIAVACGNGDDEAAPELEAATEGEVTILHAFTSDDANNLNLMLDDFRDQYPDITVTEEGSNDFESLARTRIGAGNAPDIILHPQPGLLEDFYNQGAVTALDNIVDVGQLEQDAVGGLLDLVTFNDELYAVPMRLSLKSIVWYNPRVFEDNGYAIPETWDELMDLTEQIASEDAVDAPWCIGMESGDATGWVATDWVEDIVLRTAGPDAYDDWIAGDLAFASDEIRGAIEDYMAPIWTNDDYVFGGQQQIARESFETSVTGILDLVEDPECAMHRQATFAEGFITGEFDEAEFGVDYDFFYLPPIDDTHGNVTMGGGDFAALYTENGAAVTLMEWLTTAESGEAWAAQGGFLSPYAPVFNADAYDSESAIVASDILAESSAFRFDASDAMPGDVGSSSQSGSFWIEMTNWITGAKDLESALEDIDALYESLQ